MKKILSQCSIIFLVSIFLAACAAPYGGGTKLTKQEAKANEMVNFYGNNMTGGWMGSNASYGTEPNEPKGGTEPYNPLNPKSSCGY